MMELSTTWKILNISGLEGCEWFLYFFVFVGGEGDDIHGLVDY